MKIDFSFNTQYGIYRDALYLEDNHNFTEQQIEAMKQERVDNWVYSITNPISDSLETSLDENSLEENIE